MNKLDRDRIVVDGITFHNDKMKAIQGGMGFNLNGDVYTNIVEFSDGGKIHHFFSMVISPSRPKELKTSTGMNGNWKKMQSPKVFSSYFYVIDAVTANIDDISE